MAIKVYKTNRAARKRASIVDRKALNSDRPYPLLVRSKKRTSGRGSFGKITVRHRGGRR